MKARDCLRLLAAASFASLAFGLQPAAAQGNDALIADLVSAPMSMLVGPPAALRMSNTGTFGERNDETWAGTLSSQETPGQFLAWPRKA